MTKENYMNINLNLINPNVIDYFDIVQKLPDNSVVMIKYEDLTFKGVTLNKATLGYDDRKITRYNLDVPVPNRNLSLFVILQRSSANMIKAIITDFKASYNLRCKTTEDVESLLSSFVKNTLDNVAK